MSKLSRLGGTICLLAVLISSLYASDAAIKAYNLPSGDAATVLKQFSEMSGRETCSLRR